MQQLRKTNKPKESNIKHTYDNETHNGKYETIYDDFRKMSKFDPKTEIRTLQKFGNNREQEY